MSGECSEEDGFLPLSALEHLVYCERQAALIHVDGLWRENRSTAEGRALHEAADSGQTSKRQPVKTFRTVPVRSERLRLNGVLDVVEVIGSEANQTLRIVEYKRGRKRRWLEHAVQVGAQMLALGEMRPDAIIEGTVFYGGSKRRVPVQLDDALVRQVEAAANRLHALVVAREVPAPLAPGDARCRDCSLASQCMPEREPFDLHRLLDEATA